MTAKMNPGKKILKYREFPKSINRSGKRFVPNKYLRTESSARSYGKEMCEDLGIDYRILHSSLDDEYAVYIVDGRAVSHATSKDPYEQIEELEERIEHASSESEKYDLKRRLMYLKAMVGVSNPSARVLKELQKVKQVCKSNRHVMRGFEKSEISGVCDGCYHVCTVKEDVESGKIKVEGDPYTSVCKYALHQDRQEAGHKKFLQKQLQSNPTPKKGEPRVGVSNPKNNSDNNWAVVSTDKLGRPGETYRGMRIVKSGLTNKEAKKMASKFRSQLTRTDKDFYKLTYKTVRIPKPKPLRLSNKMVVISTKDEENPRKNMKPIIFVGLAGLALWYFTKNRS